MRAPRSPDLTLPTGRARWAPASARGRAGVRRLRQRLSAVRPVWAPWVVSRLLAAGVLLVTMRHQGLAHSVLVWDGAWYAAIAERGYREDVAALRFFPLLPLLGRVVGYVFGGNVTVGLLLTTNLAALVYLTLLATLTRQETGERGAARRVGWLAVLAPGAVALALPYTEAVAGALAVAMFLLVRRRRLAGAAVCGLLGGLLRPTGVLLAVPAAIELFRERPRTARDWFGRGLAVTSPLLGTGCYLLWCGIVYGRALLPYTVQARVDLRGAWVANPLSGLLHSSDGGLDWRLTVLVAAVAVGLLAVAARRLPLSYALWSGLMLAAAITSAHGHSLPRYLASIFPLLIAAALLTRSRVWFGLVLGACVGGFTALAVMSFTTAYVP